MFLIELLFQILFALSIGAAIYIVSALILLPRKPDATDSYDITTRDGWSIRLYRYRGRGDAASHEPVLLVHGANTNQWNMAAPGDESLVAMLVRNGFDAWCIELRGCLSSVAPAGKSRFSATMDDYIRYDIPAAIDHILSQSEHDKLHAVGCSMGGIVLCAYIATNGAGPIHSAVTIGTPPGFDPDPSWSKFRKLVTISSKLPRPFEWIWKTFAPFYPVLKLNSEIAPVDWHNMHKAADPNVFYNATEMLPPPVATTILDWATGDAPQKLMDGSLDYEECFSKVDLPMKVFYGGADPLTPKSKMSRMFDALPNPDKQLVLLARSTHCVADYNHLDLVWGRDSRKDVFVPVTQWFAAHPFDGNPQVEFRPHPQ